MSCIAGVAAPAFLETVAFLEVFLFAFLRRGFVVMNELLFMSDILAIWLLGVSLLEVLRNIWRLKERTCFYIAKTGNRTYEAILVDFYFMGEVILVYGPNIYLFREFNL